VMSLAPTESYKIGAGASNTKPKNLANSN
jgi:hypothetical protein